MLYTVDIFSTALRIKLTKKTDSGLKEKTVGNKEKKCFMLKTTGRMVCSFLCVLCAVNVVNMCKV